MIRIAHPDGTTDLRYSVTREHCGEAAPAWVARFCGDWIGKAATEGAAWKIADDHHRAAVTVVYHDDCVEHLYPSVMHTEYEGFCYRLALKGTRFDNAATAYEGRKVYQVIVYY
ncbi:hypothetical protein P8631_11550 (plasmid) [Guyparkeria sp. 1SP6A2]|nr:hypothetical protein [Guyparkeria sp. 1SP6A2]